VGEGLLLHRVDIGGHGTGVNEGVIGPFAILPDFTIASIPVDHVATPGAKTANDTTFVDFAVVHRLLDESALIDGFRRETDGFSSRALILGVSENRRKSEETSSHAETFEESSPGLLEGS
jgi:hypothetical protein